MQLPDCAFGRRWPVSCSAVGTVGVPTWDIAEIAFPERIVLWELNICACGAPGIDETIRLALGDQLPTSVVMVDALEPLIPGLGLQGADPRVILCVTYGSQDARHLRLPIHTAGRRLILELVADFPAAKGICVIATVSSVPREVPDWLVSGIR